MPRPSSSKGPISYYEPTQFEPESGYSAFEVEAASGRRSKSSSVRSSIRSVLSSLSSDRKLGSSNRNLSKYIDVYEESVSNEVYIVRQKYGVFSMLFSLAQTVILALMMIKCGVAPMQVNYMFGPYPDVLSEWGAKNSVLIIEDGEWWRLFTPMLLHAGVIHLICNIAVQLETGSFFEKEWGSARWLLIYVTSGFGSSILSVIMTPDALSVGSSGAIMGIFGGKLSEVVLRACERVRSKQDRIGKEVRREQCCAVSCSVICVMAFSFIPYVDWAAHLGGLVTGILIGVAIFAWEVESIVCRLILSLIGLAATVITLVIGFMYMYSGAVQPMEQLRDVCGYYQQAMGKEYECNCQRADA